MNLLSCLLSDWQATSPEEDAKFDSSIAYVGNWCRRVTNHVPRSRPITLFRVARLDALVQLPPFARRRMNLSPPHAARRRLSGTLADGMQSHRDQGASKYRRLR